MRRSASITALVVLALGLAACPGGGEEAGEVPEGWTEVRVDELAYAVPDGFEELDPPRDPNKVVEHLRGDPEDAFEYESIGVNQNAATTTTGDDLTLLRYVDEVFLVGGRLGERLEDLSVDERQELAVDGAVEAEVLIVTYFVEQLDEDVVQTVVLVRTDEYIYDLRYGSVASIHDDGVASTLPGTVRLP